MIAAGDFGRDPCFQLGDRRRCDILRGVAPTGGDIGRRSARREVDAAHKGADQTLDMATKRRPRGEHEKPFFRVC